MTAGWSSKPLVDQLFSKRPGLIVVIREMALVLVILGDIGLKDERGHG
jgi:hypothetical protein